MNTATETGVDPKEAADRLRHLLYGQDIGVVMATTAIHGSRDISRDTPSLAAFHVEKPDCYIGNFVEGFGLCEVRFAKSGCRFLTTEEVEKFERCERAVGPFPR